MLNLKIVEHLFETGTSHQFFLIFILDLILYQFDDIKHKICPY